MALLGRVSIFMSYSLSGLLTVGQGINHTYRWHRHILHDAAFSHTNKDLVQTQWVVYR